MPPPELPAFEDSPLQAPKAAGVTMALIALNVGLFAFIAFRARSFDPSVEILTAWGANYGPLTLHGQWWRVLTATVLHANAFHLLCNMYALWYAGRSAELLFARSSFFVLYLLSGVGGSVASLWWHPFVTGVGASGAIFGVYGGIAAWLAIRHRSMDRNAAASLGSGVVVIVGYNLVIGFFQEHVDAAAHVGGLVTGLLTGAALAIPLPTRMTAWTAVRPAVVGLAGMLAIAGIASRLPVVDDLRGALKRLGDVERHTNSAYEQLLAKLQQRQLTPDQFAQEVEHEVLPPWSAARDEFAHVRAGPEQKEIVRVVQYMSLRAEAMHLAAEGLKGNDPAMLQAAQQKATEAKALGVRLTSQGKAGGRPSGAAGGVSISGTIREIAVPVGGALVSLSCPPKLEPPVSRLYLQVCGSQPSTRSDADGRFVFSHVPPGNYVVRVNADGYLPEAQPEEVHEDATLAFNLRPAVDVKAAVAAVSGVERETVGRLNAALSQLREHRISNVRFSEVIQTEVLPPWERQRAELARLKPMPEPQQQRVNEIIKYMQLRADAWRLLGKAVETNNAGLMAAAKRKQDEAMALGKTFGTTVQRFEHPQVAR